MGAIRERERYEFASDNTSGICPEAWDVLRDCNADSQPSYGTDAWTARACDMIRDVFEKPDAEVYFVFNGTAANSLALSSLCQSYHSVICHGLAHVETDECGAPEFFSNGMKLLLGGGSRGKLAPEEIERLVKKRSDIHYPKPRAVSITQSTELGTVYSVEEIGAIARTARRCGLHVHMDGARFANAIESLGCAPADLSWRRGIDVLCLGGTKNGMSGTEAVVFFRPELAEEFDYRCKQAGQLASKMRFLSSQWIGMLKDDAWLSNAAHANRMALLLAKRLSTVEGVDVQQTPEANAVFVDFAPEVEEGLRRKGWRFYSFIGDGSRLMCSWATTEAAIEELVADARSVASRSEVS